MRAWKGESVSMSAETGSGCVGSVSDLDAATQILLFCDCNFKIMRSSSLGCAVGKASYSFFFNTTLVSLRFTHDYHILHAIKTPHFGPPNLNTGYAFVIHSGFLGLRRA